MLVITFYFTLTNMVFMFVFVGCFLLLVLITNYNFCLFVVK